VRLKDQETASHLHRPVTAVSPANRVSTHSSPPLTIVDRSLGTPPTTADEALAEIECQRELIAELMHSGQPTEAAELALNGMLREFASMVEYEHDMLEEFQIKRSA
jgi:hypothetical protein